MKLSEPLKPAVGVYATGRPPLLVCGAARAFETAVTVSGSPVGIAVVREHRDVDWSACRGRRRIAFATGAASGACPS